MILETQIINGSETIDVNDSELSALSLFYKAFNTRNMILMQDSWLNTNEISMDNPIGGIRRGWDEIGNGYHKIFNGQAQVYVEFYDFSIHKTEDMFFVTGKEKGCFRTNNIEIPLAIRTSRIFIKENINWKQIHHHGSIDNPELLKTYQDTILK
ncbi:MAG: nuclear transport factor 2 family protein [Bacteroidota bacterium]|nr:nuclear transport factor 2 family protein [Bacteroidota bacterium]